MADRDPMRRTPGITYEPADGTDVEDFATDYGLDAIDAGVEPEAVAAAFEVDAEWIRERDH